MQDKDRYHKTSNFGIAVFLYSRDQQVSGIDPTERHGVKDFVFVKTPHLEKLVDKYKYGTKDDPDLLVPVRVYEQARRELLDRLNN